MNARGNHKLLIWGVTNMLTGWATDHFGLFGMTSTKLSNESLNVAGLLMAVVALLLYIFIEPASDDDSTVSLPLLPTHSHTRLGPRAALAPTAPPPTFPGRAGAVGAVPCGLRR